MRAREFLTPLRDEHASVLDYELATLELSRLQVKPLVDKEREGEL